MFNSIMMPFRRSSVTILFTALTFILCLADVKATVKIMGGADPAIMKVGNNYYSAESDGHDIWVREAVSIEALGASDVRRVNVWSDTADRGDVWAPEITTDLGHTYIYFSAGRDAAHRMYFMSAASPLGTKLNLPDDQWAIDGAYFVFEGQGWFVWSGWDSETNNAEQNLYICRMNSPTQPTGDRYIISQPRESWEQGDNPRINEAPEIIIDPNGQLHVVYSANGSWSSKYCLADLRLRKGGDPTYAWDWYKSNGCLFGSHQDRMMQGWDATLYIDGPGHHTFVLQDGDINKSPGGTNHSPFVFHGVEKGTPYSWEARGWFTGSFVWWSETTYSRANVPGDTTNKGFSFKFFE
ncbi:alpha-N-arabinofuranosidase 2 [Diaporthe helianthi]|uniref:Alpha-N-arabinofuranosidase 2 n=1 Tax=Diaporthe helianthi TaxID=158607 RepID=A0A2P5I7X9_DIAHE|nr:alpha-N-arabinofuranosidase 2 [Diaporthe helianthi]